jgi:prevent-host-death family protein
MKIINLTDAKAHFSEVINQVIAGEDVIIERMGQPVVRMSHYDSAKVGKRIGLMAGQATIPDDFDEWSDEEASFLGIKE